MWHGGMERGRDISQANICGREDISSRQWGLMRMSYGITSGTKKKKTADKMGNNS